MIRSVKRVWRGELALADVFWNWAVLGGLVVNLSSTIAFLFLLMADRPVAAAIAGYAYSVPYNILVLVGVWRAARHFDGDPGWVDAARIATLAMMLAFSVT